MKIAVYLFTLSLPVFYILSTTAVHRISNILYLISSLYSCTYHMIYYYYKYTPGVVLVTSIPDVVIFHINYERSLGKTNNPRYACASDL